MKRRFEKPRIILLDSPLEYKKGESQTNVELSKEDDWATLLKMEEDFWVKWIARHSGVSAHILIRKVKAKNPKAITHIVIFALQLALGLKTGYLLQDPGHCGGDPRRAARRTRETPWGRR